MLEIQMTLEDAAVRTIVAAMPVLIGRGVHCDLRIANWRVGRQHARLRREASAIVLEDLGALGGTFVNGLRVARHVPVGPDDEILIGPCRLKVAPARRDGGSNAALPAAPPSFPVQEVAATPQPVSSLPSLQWRRRLHAALLGALDLRRRDVAGMSDAMLRAEAARLLSLIVADDAGLPLAVDREALCREVLDEAVGLGPLEPLLAAADVSEIMVNRHDEIYVERDGRLWRHAGAFTGEQSVRRVIERIVTPLGRRIDESSPMVDARLPDGSRVHAIIPPIALKGASLTIRKFPTRRPGMPDLLATGVLSDAMARFLTRCVRLRKNLVISGGTGTGKTTLLNVLSNEIPEGERIVTIEDAAELRLSHEHLVSLEARPSNQEGRGRIDIRELVRNALRMRPDRIVVGECRGAEAFDMLTAMNTGHEGSLTTLHANSARDALARLESMVLMAGLDLPLAVVREHIAASIDIIVQQARLSDGRRVVASVAEVTGMESGRIQLQELFRHERHGGFAGCGVVPSFAQAWQEAGQGLDVSWFAVDHVAAGAGCAARPA
ncbi:ATPase, T2SS/T4P/T4SS family [Achromobacter insuavis]|uniref:ATPase, T2SS/T4P/T4SS family n=1 Tax=Achromobacter insuavis TaxID=1287735 RepID=UPI0029DC435E|nr:Flp pilus assembly complex ATPase component TadA [Achromobacter sp.]MCG2602189.1 Flp pilus assembly complex ATPase component TadA [Achromobacter sp.]